MAQNGSSKKKRSISNCVKCLLQSKTLNLLLLCETHCNHSDDANILSRYDIYRVWASSTKKSCKWANITYNVYHFSLVSSAKGNVMVWQVGPGFDSDLWMSSLPLSCSISCHSSLFYPLKPRERQNIIKEKVSLFDNQPKWWTNSKITVMMVLESCTVLLKCLLSCALASLPNCSQWGDDTYISMWMPRENCCLSECSNFCVCGHLEHFYLSFWETHSFSGNQSHISWKGGLITCHPFNQENGGACSSNGSQSWALCQTQRQKSPFVGGNCPGTECCCWVMGLYHSTQAVSLLLAV